MEFIYDGRRPLAKLNGFEDASFVLESLKEERSENDALMKRLANVTSSVRSEVDIPNGFLEAGGRDALDVLALFLKEADTRSLPVEKDLGRISIMLDTSADAPVQLADARITGSGNHQAGIERIAQEPAIGQLTLDMEEVAAVAAG